MTFSLLGWSESQDTSNALTGVAALADQHQTPSGDNYLVPGDTPRIGAVAVIGATVTRAQIISPTLRKSSLIDVRPLNVGAEPLSPTPYMPMWDKPRELAPSEGLNVSVAENAAGAERETVLIWMMGEAQPIPEGTIETVQIDFTLTLVANVWSSGAGVISQAQTAGRYAIVGGRAESAGLVAWRLIIQGQAERPGAIGYDSPADLEDPVFRMGRMGRVWGEYESTTLPQGEFLSISADTSETVWLDVILIREGIPSS